MVKPRAKSAAKKVKSSAHRTAKKTAPSGSSPGRQAEAGQGVAASDGLRVFKVSGMDLVEKVKELVRLAQEQGYLTYTDINDALPDAVVSPEELDDLYGKLRVLEVEIVDQAEVDRVKQPEPDEEEDKVRLDI